MSGTGSCWGMKNPSTLFLRVSESVDIDFIAQDLRRISVKSSRKAVRHGFF
jgi:hypothetical protein